MRAGLALAFAIVALVAATASTVAEPPTDVSPIANRMLPLTLDVGGPPAVDRVQASPRPGVDAAAAFLEAGAAPVPTVGPRPQRAAEVKVLVKPTPRPDIAGGIVRGSGGGRSLSGLASWYCNRDGSRGPISSCHYQYPDTGGFDAYAAAGPALREAIGPGWRGRVVSVDGIAVKLVDWCQCYQGQRQEKLIDLYYDVFRRVGGNVTIRW